jgi:CRP-like cAMP-binding protein
MKYQLCLISHHNLPKKSPLEKLGSIHLLAPANFWTADEPTRRYVIPIAALRALAIDYPEIERKLIFNIARELSMRLRRADAEIRSLAD